MLKNSFIEAHISNGGREDIVRFIADVRFYDDYVGNEIVRRLFRRGYCYYFAHMLQQAFKCGNVVCVKNADHWLFQYDKVFYDIEGVYEVSEEDSVVLEGCMSTEELEQYLHVPSMPDCGSEDVHCSGKGSTQDVVAMQNLLSIY